jgi:replicative DNA helicase
MKGIIFTQFLDLVEERFGLEMVDQIICQSRLESKGEYTSIGTYNFYEFLQLLHHLSKNKSISIINLLEVYAVQIFSALDTIHPEVLTSYKNPIEMIASMNHHIEMIFNTKNATPLEVLEVKSFLPLPHFTVKEKTENLLIINYKSNMGMQHFWLGLMHEMFKHFNETATIVLEKIKKDGTEVKFTINKN